MKLVLLICSTILLYNVQADYVENHALNRPAYQSLTYKLFDAQLAADGTMNCQQSYSRTRYFDGIPWNMWWVDLGEELFITLVKIHLQTNCLNCGPIQNFTVSVGNLFPKARYGPLDTQLCKRIDNVTTDVLRIECGQSVTKSAQYVILSTPQNITLALCEVEVFTVEVCRDYNKTENQHAYGATILPEVNTLEGCKEACSTDARCLGLDYDSNDVCWIHEKPYTLKADVNVTRYEKVDNSTCPAQCADDSLCDGNATCYEENGEKTCRCNKGFLGNGTFCESCTPYHPLHGVKIRDSYQIGTMSLAECQELCTDNALCWQFTFNSVDKDCQLVYYDSKEFELQADTTWYIKTSSCIDFESPRNPCDENAFLNINIFEFCKCKPGFKGNGTNCERCLWYNTFPHERAYGGIYVPNAGDVDKCLMACSEDPECFGVDFDSDMDCYRSNSTQTRRLDVTVSHYNKKC